MAGVIDCTLSLFAKYFRFRSESSPSMAASCRRCLFGRPDPDELRQDLEQHRQRQLRQCFERWNFSFESGRPAAGRYDWQVVTAAERDVASCLRASSNDDHDDAMDGCQRLEVAATSTNCDQPAPSATTTSSQSSGGFVATVDGPRCPRDARIKRRRHRGCGDSYSLKQSSRHSTRRRTITRRRRQLVRTAGAARLTGQYVMIARFFV